MAPNATTGRQHGEAQIHQGQDADEDVLLAHRLHGRAQDDDARYPQAEGQGQRDSGAGSARHDPEE